MHFGMNGRISKSLEQTKDLYGHHSKSFVCTDTLVNR